MCNRVIWLDKGKIVAQGDSAEVVDAYTQQYYAGAKWPARSNRPSRSKPFRAAREFSSQLTGDGESLLQAVPVGLAGARQFQCSTVIHRSANDRQPQGDIDRPAEARVFQHGQALIVIHGKNRVAIIQHLGVEGSIGGQGSEQVHARCPQLLQHRNERVDFLPAHVTTFTRVRVQPQYGNARCCYAEFALQVAMQDTQGLVQEFGCDGCLVRLSAPGEWWPAPRAAPVSPAS